MVDNVVFLNLTLRVAVPFEPGKPLSVTDIRRRLLGGEGFEGEHAPALDKAITAAIPSLVESGKLVVSALGGDYYEVSPDASDLARAKDACQKLLLEATAAADLVPRLIALGFDPEIAQQVVYGCFD